MNDHPPFLKIHDPFFQCLTRNDIVIAAETMGTAFNQFQGTLRIMLAVNLIRNQSIAVIDNGITRAMDYQHVSVIPADFFEHIHMEHA